MVLGRRAVLAEIVTAVGEPPRRVICCGPPALGQVLAQAGHLVVAVGQRVQRHVAARRRALKGGGPAFLVLQGEPPRLPLGAGTVDAIVYAGALPTRPAPLVAEWERALRDGGRLVVAGSVRATLRARLRARLGGSRLRPLRAEDYTRLLLCAGFAELSQVWPRGTLVITAARARKLAA